MNYLFVAIIVVLIICGVCMCFRDLNKHHSKVIKQLKVKKEDDVITKETELKNQAVYGVIDDPIIKKQYDYSQVERPIVPDSVYTETKSLGEAPMPMPDDTINNTATYVSHTYFPPVRDIDYAASVIFPNTV